MTTAILILLGGWFLLSLLSQVSVVLPRITSLRRLGRWLCARDSFSLIPWWTFFADPMDGRLYIWYQDTHLNRDKTPWNKVKLRNPSLWRALWNPRGCHGKMLVSACISLLAMAEHEIEGQRWLVSQPYKLVLTAVMAQPRQSTSDSRQFLLAWTSGSPPVEHVECVFLSQQHQW